MRPLLLSAVVVFSALPVAAQFDLTTIEGTVNALYDVISGPEGFEIDREVFDPLYVEHARLSATYYDREGNQGVVSWSPPEAAAPSA